MGANFSVHDDLGVHKAFPEHLPFILAPTPPPPPSFLHAHESAPQQQNQQIEHQCISVSLNFYFVNFYSQTRQLETVKQVY